MFAFLFPQTLGTYLYNREWLIGGWIIEALMELSFQYASVVSIIVSECPGVGFADKNYKIASTLFSLQDQPLR